MTFPLLIRRLIAETGEGITHIDMPGGSGTASGGFDGVITATGTSAFVPTGTSVWELSVDRNAQKKADEDYVKRKSGPDGTPTSAVTYVQAILRPWTKARTWQTQRSRERRWREVRGYNLDRLHAWLDAAPATTVWLAEQLGMVLSGVRSLDSWWEGTWLPSTLVPLTADVVLAGRDEAATQLVTLLERGEPVTTLGGGLRFEEAEAFVAACLNRAEVPQGTGLKARALSVADAGSLARLVAHKQPLVLLPESPKLAANLPTSHSHRLILVAATGQTADVMVPPLDGQLVEEQLRALGLSYDRARQLGTLARRSLPALRRTLAVNPVVLTPSWATAPDGVRRRLLLIGGWDGTNTEDRRIVAVCVGQPYEQVQEAALTLAGEQGVQYVDHVDELWYVVAPEDAWTLLSGYLTRDDLVAFQKAALEVLGERDPLAILEDEERLRASLSGVRPKYSGELRQALARTLALLGSTATGAQTPGGRPLSGHARRIVRELLDRVNADRSYALWASLADVLPVVAEAAPEEFLQAMSTGLTGQSPLHAAMFTDSNRTAIGSPATSPHTAFLWALESLAWSPDYLDDVVTTLGRLTELDPGGQWANRPHRSLVQVLSCWHPNTSADLDARLRVLKRLLHDYPQVGRAVLIELIPSSMESQLPHQSPQFRDWRRERSVTNGELRQGVSAVVEMLLDDLDDDPQPYLHLVERITHLSPAHRATLVDRLTILGTSLVDDTSRARLHEALRAKVADHREYADNAWALPEEELRRVEAAAEALQPHSAVLRSAWLFANDMATLGNPRRQDDSQAYEEALSRRRTAAVAEVLSEGGLGAVEELAGTTSWPHLVGVALAQHGSNLDLDMLAWLRLDEGPRRGVAFAYFVRRLADRGAQLRDQLLRQADDPLAQARVLRATYNPVDAWDKLSGLEARAAEHYWSEFSYVGLGHNFGHVQKVADGLIRARRHAAALDFIALYGRKANSVKVAEAAATAFEGLLASGMDDPELPHLHQDTFKLLFALLAQHRDAIGRQRIIHIEWQMFPVLGFDADAPTLHTALSEEPAFFAELVSYVYRRDDRAEDPNGGEVDRERGLDFARRASEVLHTWRRCPGVIDDGTIDPARLRSWVMEARDRLRADDRLGSGDEQLGQVLAFAPNDTDGSFPPAAVRELLEEIRSGRLDNGLAIGIYNKRGVTTRGILEGGTQEWELARSYREQATNFAARPRTRTLLNRLADMYEGDARRLDESAERRHRGIHE